LTESPARQSGGDSLLPVAESFNLLMSIFTYQEVSYGS